MFFFSDGECEVTENQVLGVQQIIQRIEEINSKKTTPFIRQKSQPKNSSLARNSTPLYTTDEFYEPMQAVPKHLISSQSFRKSR